MEHDKERKPLTHDEPTSDEWATGALGRPAGALETKEWGETFFTAPRTQRCRDFLNKILHH